MQWQERYFGGILVLSDCLSITRRVCSISAQNLILPLWKKLDEAYPEEKCQESNWPWRAISGCQWNLGNLRPPDQLALLRIVSNYGHWTVGASRVGPRCSPLWSAPFSCQSNLFRARMAHMNGFAKLGLDDDTFGEKSALSRLRTFDAFRK